MTGPATLTRNGKKIAVFVSGVSIDMWGDEVYIINTGSVKTAYVSNAKKSDVEFD